MLPRTDELQKLNAELCWLHCLCTAAALVRVSRLRLFVSCNLWRKDHFLCMVITNVARLSEPRCHAYCKRVACVDPCVERGVTAVSALTSKYRSGCQCNVHP